MGEQLGLVYNEAPNNIATPNNNRGLRLFKNLNDGNWYVKKSDGTIELFVAGLSSVLYFQGMWDASGGTFPVNGSGGAGIVIKGDMWIISVGGTLDGRTVEAGAHATGQRRKTGAARRGGVQRAARRRRRGRVGARPAGRREARAGATGKTRPGAA